MTDLEKQSIPSESKCPECGGDPNAESRAQHTLSDLGYLHDDVDLECEDCSTSWTLGIPVGDGPENDELWCDSCDDTRMLIHRFRIRNYEDKPNIKMHLKCPNCYFFKISNPRNVDENDLVLTGYPEITGDTDEAESWGWIEGEAPWDDE
jgi:predicted Zn-ribbon and HTH transcriptional regulator